MVNVKPLEWNKDDIAVTSYGSYIVQMRDDIYEGYAPYVFNPVFKSHSKDKVKKFLEGWHDCFVNDVADEIIDD